MAFNLWMKSQVIETRNNSPSSWGNNICRFGWIQLVACIVVGWVVEVVPDAVGIGVVDRPDDVGLEVTLLA